MSTLFSAEAPPYVVVGTAKFSFLARIELSFNGIGEAESSISDAQRIVVEHWVEVWDVDPLSDFHFFIYLDQLDPLKTVTPVLGEEQTIDIELDKRTVIGPAQTCPISIKVFWDVKATNTELSAANDGQDPASGKCNHSSQALVTLSYVKLEYTQMLDKLVSSFPMIRGK